MTTTSVSIANRTSARSKIIPHSILGIYSLCCIVPILLIIITSFMYEKDILTTGYTFLPRSVTLQAYKTVFKNPALLFNSYVVTIGITVVGTVVGLWLTTTVAYIITRKDYALRKQVSFYVFFTMIINGGLVPTYILIVSWLHLKDTYLVMLIPHLCVAYNVLLMKGFLQTIPDEIIESSKLDGANEIRIFVQIIIPLSKSALATVGLFIAFAYWNDWFQSYMYVTSNNKFMLQTLLVLIMQNIDFLNSSLASNMGLSGIEIPSYSARMAMCVLAMSPMLFIFPFFQKYFTKGIMIGSVKG